MRAQGEYGGISSAVILPIITSIISLTQRRHIVIDGPLKPAGVPVTHEARRGAVAKAEI